MNNVRRIRRQKDMTQYDLSKKTRIPQSSLSLIERLYKHPNRKMKKRISRTLGYPIKNVFPEYVKNDEDRKKTGS